MAARITWTLSRLDQLNDINNPFTAPNAELPAQTDSHEISTLLWVLWAASLAAPPLAMLFSRFTVDYYETQIPFNWLYCIPLIGCLVIPWVPRVPLSRRLAYFFFSLVAGSISVALAYIVLLTNRFFAAF